MSRQISGINEQYNKAQEYIANLQEYNAQKQRESIALNQEKLGLQEEHKALTGQVAKLSGDNTVLQAQLESGKVQGNPFSPFRASPLQEAAPADGGDGLPPLTIPRFPPRIPPGSPAGPGEGPRRVSGGLRKAPG